MHIDIEKLYKKYGPMVLRRCKFLLKDEDKALDAMQDVFLRVLKRKILIKDKGLCSYLFRTATSVCLNIIRKDKRIINSDDEMLYEITINDQFDNLIHIRHFFEKVFGDEYASTKTMALLHYVDGLTLEQTAKMTGFSVSGVRKRLDKFKQRTKIRHEE